MSNLRTLPEWDVLTKITGNERIPIGPSLCVKLKQLPIVRTDMPQEIAAEGQEMARLNISAVGTLPVALSLAEDNTLSVASAPATLTAHYKLYAANPGAYRWTVMLSDASGAPVEEVEAGVIPADGVLHLPFRSVQLGQTYDLALTITGEAVSAALVAPWLRDRHAGANTSSGQYATTATDLNKYNGDRGLEVFFRTGSDISTRQNINSNQPLEVIVEGGRLYISMWGLRTNGYNILPDTDYHVVAALDKEKREASLYVNGNFALSGVRADTAPVYSTYNMIGRANGGNYPFKGTIYHARLFDHAPAPEDVAVLYNNGAPAGHVVPAEMRGAGNSYRSNFGAGADGWVASGADTSVVWKGGFLEATSKSGHIRTRRTAPVAELATTKHHAYAFEVVVEGNPEFSHMQFFAYSSQFNTNVSKSSGEIIDGGIRLRGVVVRKENAAFSRECYCHFYNTPVGSIVRIRSLRITPLSCIAEYLPQNVTMSVWYDSANQPPQNGAMPPLWSSVGGYDLTASDTPQIIYKDDKQVNVPLLAEVLAHSDCTLEERIARLEAALVALTTGDTFIPKLSVRKLDVWGDNNLIVTGTGAPTKAPDRAGQFYIDTKNNAVYRSIGNGAVSDWKNN